MAALKYTNPVWPGYFADPFVWPVREEYYAIGTGAAEAGGIANREHRASIFPLLRSRDLVHWTPAGHALIPPDPLLGDTFWAPEVAHARGQWFLYYSVGHEDRLHQLRVACSDHPLGPYRDCAALTSLAECAFAIDPHPFEDVDGRWYLFHARDFLDTVGEEGRPVRAGTALVVHALHGMTQLGREGRVVARARYDWQRFAASRPMYGQVFDWHTLEGPFVIRHEGRYFCLYSGGCWHEASYGVDYVVAESVLGPYVDADAEAGPRVLRTVPNAMLGPGHCSVVDGPENGAPVIVYHAWDPAMTARRLCIDPLVFTPEGPRSPGPTYMERSLSDPGPDSGRAR